MPLAGFRCPPHTATAGDVQPIEHCLDGCPHPCVAPPLLAAMWSAEQRNIHKGAYLSASMLCGSSCSRQTVFEREHDFYEYPIRRYWPFRGTHAHSIVEHAAGFIEGFGWMQEMRMAVDFVYDDHAAPIMRGGTFTGRYNERKPLVIRVGGTTDCYNPLRREMWDMKSCADTKALMMVTGAKAGEYSKNLEDSWVKQLNIYRLLVSKTPIDPGVREKLKLEGEFYPAPETLGIQAIAMMDIPRTGTSYAFMRRVGKYRGDESFEIDSVPVWPLEETEVFVRREALQWFKWLVLREPTPVVGESKKWLCGSCAFNAERYPEGRCWPTAERESIQGV